MSPTGIDLNQATAVASGIECALARAVAVLMDVSDHASVNQGFEQIGCDLGEVDILVSNSAIQIVDIGSAKRLAAGSPVFVTVRACLAA